MTATTPLPKPLLPLLLLLLLTTTANAQVMYLGCGTFTNFNDFLEPRAIFRGASGPQACANACTSHVVAESRFYIIGDGACYCTGYLVTPVFSTNPYPSNALCTVRCADGSGSTCGGTFDGSPVYSLYGLDRVNVPTRAGFVDVGVVLGVVLRSLLGDFSDLKFLGIRFFDVPAKQRLRFQQQ
ncbi:hypothetical protein CkaCkLH20_09249 [Colletotrichum karsti]|uniref:WSC domain-containing protein n=1 Tax=Colletotrichum karsti TaxID=1095194 RepID=A0A9P6LHR1_9PEZI|nr:uncharacterized protein CkaCkLH20_09249 [Colletotrichum karsti]KAF9873436.1 hypothetical protein CkaCkLH20_09249 [Colletotrichum karsti]